MVKMVVGGGGCDEDDSGGGGCDEDDNGGGGCDEDIVMKML